MFKWFSGKKDVRELKEEVKRSFESVKKDINSINGWVNFLDSEKKSSKSEIELIKTDLSTIKKEIEGIKNVISFIGEIKINKSVQTANRVFKKQTAVYGVQTAVQTAVQTPNLSQFSTSERALLWVLLNSEMRLSYDDISAMLGKERSTIRGQINAIKQKSEGLINEIIEENGKKRVFINEEIKEKLMKKEKVSVKEKKKERKNG